MSESGAQDPYWRQRLRSGRCCCLLRGWRTAVPLGRRLRPRLSWALPDDAGRLRHCSAVTRHCPEGPHLDFPQRLRSPRPGARSLPISPEGTLTLQHRVRRGARPHPPLRVTAACGPRAAELPTGLGPTSPY
ncbi:hypothetical protein NDU88_002349 [Pleurodeles waltl]|uniref:Uncharacterized protein n=1 Tax=Pleurodeles waltl TaxID=8319 RepID=A0AAV7SE26_PLEWA|nr:hypothetical protein NDU88_002349 [Pleurodeles waltl]